MANSQVLHKFYEPLWFSKGQNGVGYAQRSEACLVREYPKAVVPVTLVASVDLLQVLCRQV